MANVSKQLCVLLCLCAVATIGYAACADIRASCNKNFELDMKSCGNFMDKQAEQCYARAHQQLAYCVKSGGC